jgi:hypothetical protein
MICVTTHFRLNHFWMLLPMYLTYRRMRRDLNQAPGLIRYAFLVQSPVACCTLSLLGVRGCSRHLLKRAQSRGCGS